MLEVGKLLCNEKKKTRESKPLVETYWNSNQNQLFDNIFSFRTIDSGLQLNVNNQNNMFKMISDKLRTTLRGDQASRRKIREKLEFGEIFG